MSEVGKSWKLKTMSVSTKCLKVRCSKKCHKISKNQR